MLRKARPGNSRTADHGRYIYAYRHIRTNQVVYSLQQTLNSNAAIKQMPDLGANGSDKSVRKDLWQPLYTLSLGSSDPHTLAQGLHAFKKLREYRKLHELNWTPPASLAQPYSESQIERMRLDLEERGGNKKESVYDIIKRRKRALRGKLVRDQKANSIADLAAVLLEQEDLGVKTKERREKEVRGDREREVKEMLDLAAKAEDGELAQLEEQVEAQEKRLESKAEEATEGQSRTQMKREWYRLNARMLRMRFAADAVAEVVDPGKRAKMRKAKEQAAQAKREQEQRELDQEEAALEVESAAGDPEPAPKRTETHYEKFCRKLRNLIVRHDQGDFASLPDAIAEGRRRLTSARESGDAKAELSSERKVREYLLRTKSLELALEAARKDGYSGDMSVEGPGIWVQLKEYETQLRDREIREARERGASEETMSRLEREKESTVVALGKIRTYAAEWEAGEPLARNSGTSGESSAPEEEMYTADGKSISARAADEAAASARSTTEPPSTSTATAQEGGSERTSDPDWHAVLPSFPSRDPSRIPKRGPLRQKLRRLSSPIFSTEGILIKWHDPLDAEYAAMWPENVTHERMGWSRYTAPHAQAEAIEDISEFKEGLWRKRAANWLPVGEEREVGEIEGVEGGEGEAALEAQRRKGFVEGIKGKILEEVRRKEEERMGSTGGSRMLEGIRQRQRALEQQ